jgi:hypothetical protein
MKLLLALPACRLPEPGRLRQADDRQDRLGRLGRVAELVAAGLQARLADGAEQLVVIGD